MYVQISILPNISYTFFYWSLSILKANTNDSSPFSLTVLSPSPGQMSSSTPVITVITEKRGLCLGTSKWTTPASADTSRCMQTHLAAPRRAWE